MELNDPNRNRRVGFLGVTIATLLTPGGKLFTSAMAAATVAGLVTMNLAPKDEASQPVSANHSDALLTDGEILDVGNLSTGGDTPDTLSAATLISEPNATLGNQPGFTMQTMPSANIAASNIAGMNISNSSGGNGPTVLPPPIFPPHDDIDRDPKKPECTVVLVGELANNTELTGDEVICLEEEDVAKKNGDPVSTGGDPESTGDPEPKSADGPGPELIVALAPPESELPPEIVGPTPDETSPPKDAPTFEPLLIQPLASVAAVPEPTTLALFLLGLLGFAQVYRKNKYQK